LIAPRWHADMKKLWPTVALALLAIVTLVLTFLAYLRPGFALDLANRIMLCF